MFRRNADFTRRSIECQFNIHFVTSCHVRGFADIGANASM
jgi:hypothetical protein